MRFCCYIHFSVQGPHVAPEGDLGEVFEGDHNVDLDHWVQFLKNISAFSENIDFYLSGAHFTFKIGTLLTIL